MEYRAEPAGAVVDTRRRRGRAIYTMADIAAKRLERELRWCGVMERGSWQTVASDDRGRRALSWRAISSSTRKLGRSLSIGRRRGPTSGARGLVRVVAQSVKVASVRRVISGQAGRREQASRDEKSRIRGTFGPGPKCNGLRHSSHGVPVTIAQRHRRLGVLTRPLPLCILNICTLHRIL